MLLNIKEGLLSSLAVLGGIFGGQNPVEVILISLSVKPEPEFDPTQPTRLSGRRRRSRRKFGESQKKRDKQL